jgi:hypothetical protein
MKTDVQGCSTCVIGGFQVEPFVDIFGRRLWQWDYRDPDGKLHSGISINQQSAQLRALDILNAWRRRKGAA